MTEIGELLKQSEAEPVRSTPDDVARRVSRRRRRRHIARAAAGAAAVSVGVVTWVSFANSESAPDTQITADEEVDERDDPAPDDQPVLVAEGPVSAIHVEQVDLVFPECTGRQDRPDLERLSQLETMYFNLLNEGLLDLPEPEFVNGIDATFNEGTLRIALSRRHGPTIDWFVQRVEPADLCFDVIPPRGFYTGPPDLLPWDVDWRAPLAPERQEIEILGMGPCGLDTLGSTWREQPDRVEVAILYREWPGTTNDCAGAYPVTVHLEEPLGDRHVVQAPTPETLTAEEPVVSAGGTATFSVDPILQRNAETIGDDVILQSLDDPARQIQVSQVFGDRPSPSLPQPIEQDRWSIPASFSVPIPATLPAGEYSLAFIDDPAFNGRITVVGGSTCPPEASGLRLSGGVLVAEQPAEADSEGRTACWYVGALFSAPFQDDDRITTATTYYVDGQYESGETSDGTPPIG